jgi:hypothetical protein
MKDPVKLFHAAVQGIEQERWRDVAELCDPVSLRAFKQSFLSQFDTAGLITWTIEELLRFSPGMPRAVAEYQLAQIERQTDPAVRFSRDFPLLKDIAELRDLDPADVFARWLEGKSPRGQILAAVRDGSISEAVAAAHGSDLGRLPPYEAIGAIKDGDDVAYVIWRFGKLETGEVPEEAMEELSAEEQEFANIDEPHPSIALCRRQPDASWKLIAEQNFLHMGSISIGFSEDRAT